jgi:hypothetical protein
MRRTLFAAACRFVAAAQAGQFTYGLASSRSDRATLRRPTTPEVLLDAKRVAVAVRDATNSFADAEGLRLEIERRLTRGFQIAPSQPEARIRVTVGPAKTTIVSFRGCDCAVSAPAWAPRNFAQKTYRESYEAFTAGQKISDEKRAVNFPAACRIVRWPHDECNSKHPE